ncbi:MAG: SURF1 family protein [Betaproteobacteria bacterium]|nr:SURF1 family protein [Betaproteobacteria bacterium]
MKSAPRWTFRPRLVTTAAAVAFCALSVSLGNWQIRRAAEKETAQAQREARARAEPVTLPAAPIDAEAWTWRRVAVRGELVSRYAILIDNRTREGRAGYEVVMPMRIGGSDRYVLVNRGWVAQGRTRDALPSVRTPAGPVRLEGIAVLPPVQVFELGDTASASRVWPHLDLARFRSWSGLALQPIVVLQTSDLDDGLVRRWPRAESGAARHRAYALQWYIFALLTVVLYVALNLKRHRAG